MSFNWLGYLNTAQELMNKVDEFSDQEAIYRASVSRAYYAVFCLARNYVKDNDKTEFYGNDHQRLQDYLIGHAYKPRKTIGKRLRDLHQHRIKADYHDELDEPAIYKATKAISIAKTIVQGLTEIYS